jgi:hypothetical protein
MVNAHREVISQKIQKNLKSIKFRDIRTARVAGC